MQYRRWELKTRVPWLINPRPIPDFYIPDSRMLLEGTTRERKKRGNPRLDPGQNVEKKG